MKALILCAGLGTRLGEITKTIPKCMVGVESKPILQRLIDHLNSHQITKIFVNLHQFPEQVYQYFGSQLFFLYEPNLLGWGNTISLVTAIDYEDNWVIMNGDTLTNVDITDMGRVHTKKKAYITRFYKEKFGGTMIISPYRVGKPQMIYRSDAYCFDIGTPEKLQKAREYFANH